MMDRQFQGGFPGFPGGFPGFQGGGGQGGGQQGTLTQPPGPPPSFTPQAQTTQQGLISTQAVDPGAIRGCLFRWTYVWLRGGEQFWFFPVFIGRRSVAGFRWYGWGWFYFGVDLRRIVQFRCF